MYTLQIGYRRFICFRGHVDPIAKIFPTIDPQEAHKNRFSAEAAAFPRNLKHPIKNSSISTAPPESMSRSLSAFSYQHVGPRGKARPGAMLGYQDPTLQVLSFWLLQAGSVLAGGDL